MLQYIKKDLLSINRGVIAHGCNYVGVMGAGVAALIKRKYPAAYKEYVALIEHVTAAGNKQSSLLGHCQIVTINDELVIANCFTQGLESFDGQLASPDAIGASLGKAFQVAQSLKLPLSLPKIGAGLGGLDWERDVEPILKVLCHTYADVDTYVCVYP